MKIAAEQLHELLPQTQCRRCAYADCAAYAQAIACEDAPINQCPPGGEQGVRRLAAVAGRPFIPLNPQFGQEQERTLAFIDEDWCIGCTLCIKACPVDAIVGASKQMHTVIESHCTGCELCIPVCPVDCIEIEIATPGRTGWQAWTDEQAQSALKRYTQRSKRLGAQQAQRSMSLEGILSDKLQALTDHPETVSKVTDSQALEHKRRVVQAALDKARQRNTPKA